MFSNSFILSLLGFLIILTPLVFIHELGHYFAATINKVKVEIFSVGFGKELFGFFDKNNTRWKFCLLPFGGYVKMKGELVVNEKNSIKNSNNTENFNHASLFSRFIIVFSGPLANVVFGVLLISILYCFNGRLDNRPIVGEVINNSSAYNGGLIKDDEIIQIDEISIKNFYQLKDIVEKNAEKSLLFKIKRNDQILNLKLIPKSIFNEETNKKIGRIGIIGKKPKLIHLNFVSSVIYGISDTYEMTKEWLKGLKNIIFFKHSSNDVAGPVGIAKISGEALNSGWANLIFLMAILSINLGLINLLPIPALDGGYIILYFLEFLTGKPLPEKIQLRLIQFGVFFLISLMLFITLLDIRKLFV